jgi:hypothetical protein
MKPRTRRAGTGTGSGCRDRRSACTAALLACALVILPESVVHADEGGASFWLPGQYASLAAVPGTLGWSLPSSLYYYDGSASASAPVQRGGVIAFGLDSREPLLLVQPTYTPESKVLGGQLSIGLGIGYGRDTARADAALSSGIGFGLSDSVWGWADLTPIASLAWNRAADNWMVYLTGNIPTGSYDSKRLANIGIGHGAIDAGGGYTYFNEKTGREFSAVLGFTYNFENTSTNYKNGIDSHLDWAVSQFLSANLELGLAGYVYYQLTGDSGSGATFGPFKSKVAAIGPEVGYQFNIGRQQWSTNLRGYWEFWAENRLQGYALFATLNIPLTP